MIYTFEVFKQPSIQSGKEHALQAMGLLYRCLILALPEQLNLNRTARFLGPGKFHGICRDVFNQAYVSNKNLNDLFMQNLHKFTLLYQPSSSTI